MSSIDFCGLEHFPLGNANVALNDDGNIGVSNLVTPADGVVIRTNNACEWKLEINPVQIEPDDVWGATYNMIDNLNRLKTVAQWSLRQDPNGDGYYLYVNSKLEGDVITVRGTLDEEEVFVREYNKSDNPDNNWIVVLYFLASAVVGVILSADYKSVEEVTTNSDGTQSKVVTTTKSVGTQAQVKAVEGLAPSDPVLEDEVFDIDHIYISSSRSYPVSLDAELGGRISEVILNIQTNKSLVINNEEYQTVC